jgi:hypothetical protein
MEEGRGHAREVWNCQLWTKIVVFYEKVLPRKGLRKNKVTFFRKP